MGPLRLSALLLALFAAAPAGAQVLYGRVADAADGSPVAAARVIVLDTAGAIAATTQSRGDGRYELRLPAAGAYRLQVSRVGYRTGVSGAVSIGGRERMEVELRLRADAVQLEGVTARTRVTPPFRDARARRFYERMERGRGRFISPERVQERDASTTGALLRTVPGVSFSSGLGSGGLRLGGRVRGCTPILYLDGFRFHPYPGWRLDDHIAVGEVWAVEIYMDAIDIPPDLPRDGIGRCGIVMIWTTAA